MGKLVLVPTPLGNLGDVTDRAKTALVEADVVLAEDTRTTGKLLKLLGLEAKLRPYHMHNEHAQAAALVRRVAESSGHVALASDAGTPGISDPGFLLVRACIEAGLVVEALPGPTALIPALVASGFPCDRFVFEGFVPQKKGRQTRIQSWRTEPRTLVAYESPHRLRKLLDEVVAWLGPDRGMCVVRELSKVHETYHRGTAAELQAYFAQVEPRGELVVILEGASSPQKTTES
jgi:16S rRNA (cytidine1402-2'-O)-methyltransferase